MLPCIYFFSENSETSLHLTTLSAVVSGETALMESQRQEFPKNQELRIKMQRLQDPYQNGISVWLEGTYGVSRIPVIHQGISMTAQDRSDRVARDGMMNCGSDDDVLECSFCVPGGENVAHRVILAGVYQTHDDFYIHEIELGDENCIFPTENIATGKWLLPITELMI